MLKVGDNVTPRYPKGEGGYEKSNFQSVLGGTAAFTNRLAIATKGCGQLTSNNTYFSDIWFSSVKTAEEMAAAGVDYCRPVKTNNKGFCLASLEQLTKDWPGGSYLVLKSTPRFTDKRPLLAIGYKYNSRKVLGFIATEGAGSTEPGDPYLSCFPEIIQMFLFAMLFVLTLYADISMPIMQ